MKKIEMTKNQLKLCEFFEHECDFVYIDNHNFNSIQFAYNDIDTLNVIVIFDYDCDIINHELHFNVNDKIKCMIITHYHDNDNNVKMKTYDNLSIDDVIKYFE